MYSDRKHYLLKWNAYIDSVGYWILHSLNRPYMLAVVYRLGVRDANLRGFYDSRLSFN